MFYELITRLLALFIKLHSIHLVFLFETYPNATIKYDESRFYEDNNFTFLYVS